MSDYLYGIGYDAGAVIDMNNLVAGCLPHTPLRVNPQPCSIPLEPAQDSAVPPGHVVIPVAESETNF